MDDWMDENEKLMDGWNWKMDEMKKNMDGWLIDGWMDGWMDGI